MLWIILAIIISYFFGSIPTAFIYGKLFKGIDIRKSGSGNIGATNALRVFGKRAGILVLFIDVLKGIIPVIFLGDYVLLKTPDFGPVILLRLLIGLSCIFGHIWTVFLNFKGGKGVATTFGVLIGLSFRIPAFSIILGIVILTWLLVFLTSRTVSLASISCGIAFLIAMIVLKQPPELLIFSILVSFFIILRHKSNLKRILQGKEPRLNFSKK